LSARRWALLQPSLQQRAAELLSPLRLDLRHLLRLGEAIFRQQLHPFDLRPVFRQPCAKAGVFKSERVLDKRPKMDVRQRETAAHFVGQFLVAVPAFVHEKQPGHTSVLSHTLNIRELHD
jgi:hypothetical protein